MSDTEDTNKINKNDRLINKDGVLTEILLYIPSLFISVYFLEWLQSKKYSLFITMLSFFVVLSLSHSFFTYIFKILFDSSIGNKKSKEQPVKWRKYLKNIVIFILIPLIITIAGNFITKSGQPLISYLINVIKGNDQNLVDRISFYILNSDQNSIKKAGIYSLAEIESEESLKSLIKFGKIFVSQYTNKKKKEEEEKKTEDLYFENYGSVYKNIVYGVASFKKKAKKQLIQAFFASTEKVVVDSKQDFSDFHGNDLEQYFKKLLNGIEDPNARQDLRQRLEEVDAIFLKHLKAVNKNLPKIETVYTMPYFIMDCFDQMDMDEYNGDNEVGDFAKMIFLDTKFKLETRTLAASVMAKHGNKKDIQILLKELSEIEDIDFRAGVLRAVGILHKRVQ